MPYTPFVRLIKPSCCRRKVEFIRDFGPSSGDELIPDAFSCSTCGDRFAFGDTCPRCEEPLTPLLPQAA